PRAARRRPGEYPDLGPARRAEGGGVRVGARDRGGRGAGGRSGDPRRPQPHGHPRPDRGCGRGGAVGRAPVVRARVLRPRQRFLRGVGSALPRSGCARTLPRRLRARRVRSGGVPGETAGSGRAAQGEGTALRRGELRVLTARTLPTKGWLASRRASWSTGGWCWWG